MAAGMNHLETPCQKRAAPTSGLVLRAAVCLVCGVAGLPASGMASPGFSKPEPGKFMAQYKILQPDGAAFRIPKEDWDGARRRVAADPAWNDWLVSQRAETDAWMQRHRDRPEWWCGVNSRFVSPRDGSYLVWTDEIPGKEAKTLKSITGHDVEVTPDIFGAWIYRFRGKHMDRMIVAARLFRLTGDERYARWAAEQLDFYAQHYEEWPIVQVGEDNRARLSAHGLNDAQFLSKLVETTRLLFDWAGKERRQMWFDKLFQPEVELLNHSFRAIHNIAVWHRSAQAQVALLYGDEEIWKRQMDGPWGLREQFRKGVTSDFIWHEQSLSYNNFVVHAMLPLLTLAGLTGKEDRLAEEAALVGNLILSPLRLAFPDGTLPNPADQTGIAQASAMLPPSAARVLPTTIDLGGKDKGTLLTWDILVDPPGKPSGTTSTGLPKVKSLNLESTRFALMKKGGWQVFFHYGQLVPIHAQSEALNWSASYKGVNISHDPGTVGYGSPFHSEYYTRGLNHNMPLVNGEGQKPPHLGELLVFDADGGEVAASQPDYIPGRAAATRRLRIEGDALVEETSLNVGGGNPARLGLSLHLQGEPRLPDTFHPVSKFSEGRPAAFKYWKDVKAADFRDHAEVAVAFPGGLVMKVGFSVPGEFRLYQGQSPDGPGKHRAGFYLETGGNEAAFVTRLSPVNP